MSKSRFGKVSRYSIGAAALLASTTPASAAIVFNYTYTAGTSAAWQTAFQQAGARWSSIFDDNVTINLTVGTASLGSGILGQAGSNSQAYTYSQVKTALTADRSSADDNTAVANLQGGSAVNMLINRTSNSPNGSGSPTPYLDNDGDANNTTLDINTANAKALGLNVAAGNIQGCLTASCDAFIQFSTNFTFDYDGSNGIDANSFDAVGVATHEIGHALGFVSGVDVLDACNPATTNNCGGGPGAAFPDNAFTFVTTLDLFRYSNASCAVGALDFTADTRAKFFSINNCATAGPGFSTGSFTGDGSQASHWKDNLGIGIMDPTSARGELLAISANDIQAFDVIGWNRARQQGAVPEPETWAMMIAGFGVIGAAARRRRIKVTYAV